MNGRKTAIKWARRALGVALVAVLLLAGARIGNADSAPAGKLVFTRADGIYVQRMDGSPAMRVWQAPANGSGAGARWSPDGARIAFEGPDGNMWLMNADGSDAHPITAQATPGSGCDEDGCAQPGTTADTPLWSPDGQMLSYRLVEGLARGSIWTVGVAAGSAPRRVAAAGDLCIFNEGWSPSGAPLFSRCASQSSGGNAAYLAVPATGDGTAQQLVAGSQLAFSSDGRRLAYAGMAYSGSKLIVSLYLAAADGSGARMVAPDGQEPHWSSNGLLAYQIGGTDGWTIRVYDPATGADSGVGPGALGGWTPDGAWLYYTVVDDTGPSIWRIRADGTGATRIADGNFPDWTP